MRWSGAGARVEEAMGRSGHKPVTFEAIVASLGLLAALLLGAWWTGTAVAEGRIEATIIRFCLSVVGGCYYLVLYRIARYGVRTPAGRVR